MRTIKFRGKRLDTGQWIDGGYVEWRDYKGNKNHQIVSSVGYHNDVNPATVGQFTGLTDKNGKEIFEGDIAEFTNTWRGDYGITKSASYTGIVSCNKYLQSCIMVDEIEFHIEYSMRGSIIGNIHDNPELLKNE